ncbi:head GIN domain-containing protein [Parvularcula lutaonensis]|uniref:Head GIN domain-containing protein n=1 Tax=Parvularcula lutaonensis TaxID=491923 RepID=A0ABV7MBP8_9PROT|nr:head GIN domain-containing protein [Parvularcula lutaonensis]GGY36064.1 DUF2807 domain-containing protein [Parvularcula lutaonensis]
MVAFRTALCAASAASILASTAYAETKSWDLTGFDGVKSTSGVDVIVEVGPDYSIELETEGDFDTARVEVKGDTLILGRESRGMRLNFGRSARFVYRVTLPELTHAGSSAGSDLRISGIDGGDIELSSSSGSDLEAEGSCDSLDADASSGADLMAFDLECADVRAEASSGSDIEVTATRSIKARASSGADITVRGKPERRDTKASSGGSVRFRD